MGAPIDFYKKYYDDELEQEELPAVIAKNYKICACIKQTKEKQVYLIQSKSNEKKYILKKVAAWSRENLEDEYIMHRAFMHRGLIPATEFMKDDEYSYLIRDYVEGYTITELVEMKKTGILTDQEIIDITRQLCQVLDYLHNQNPPVIHRDIKPDNIIVNHEGVCKLIDFGISRRFQGDHDKDTVIMGTEYTAAPEQYGFKQTDTRSDIYSIGILMFYMATGSLDIREIESHIISRRIKNCIKKCTQFSPDDRYKNVKRLEEELSKGDKQGIGKWLMMFGIGGVAILGVLVCAGVYLSSNLVRGQQKQTKQESNILALEKDDIQKETDLTVSNVVENQKLVDNILKAMPSITSVTDDGGTYYDHANYTLTDPDEKALFTLLQQLVDQVDFVQFNMTPLTLEDEYSEEYFKGIADAIGSESNNGIESVNYLFEYCVNGSSMSDAQITVVIHGCINQILQIVQSANNQTYNVLLDEIITAATMDDGYAGEVFLGLVEVFDKKLSDESTAKEWGNYEKPYDDGAVYIEKELALSLVKEKLKEGSETVNGGVTNSALYNYMKNSANATDDMVDAAVYELKDIVYESNLYWYNTYQDEKGMLSKLISAIETEDASALYDCLLVMKDFFNNTQHISASIYSPKEEYADIYLSSVRWFMDTEGRALYQYYHMILEGNDYSRELTVTGNTGLYEAAYALMEGGSQDIQKKYDDTH